jgi:tRNA G18 (ribose-2'-O)-methylase SpoU
MISPDDPRIADYRNIPDAELIERRGIFIAEGRLVVRRLLEGSRMRTRSVMVTEAARASLQDLLDARPDVPVYVVSQASMNAMAGFNIHRGCLAIGERPAPADWRALVRDSQRVVVLERIGNADNVGSVFRNAAAFGVDAVLLDGASTDPLYRKAIRTSMAAALTVPFARVEPWPDALTQLHATGLSVVGLTPAADAPPLADVAATLRGSRIGIALGHEADGLSPAALNACTHLARIPMAPGVDSLNVATAAAIALYELSSIES